MTFELYALAAALILGIAQIVLASHSASLQRGYGWTASDRAASLPPLTDLAGRLARVHSNYIETFGFSRPPWSSRRLLGCMTGAANGGQAFISAPV